MYLGSGYFIWNYGNTDRLFSILFVGSHKWSFIGGGKKSIWWLQLQILYRTLPSIFRIKDGDVSEVVSLCWSVECATMHKYRTLSTLLCKVYLSWYQQLVCVVMLRCSWSICGHGGENLMKHPLDIILSPQLLWVLRWRWTAHLVVKIFLEALFILLCGEFSDIISPWITKYHYQQMHSSVHYINFLF